MHQSILLLLGQQDFSLHPWKMDLKKKCTVENVHCGSMVAQWLSSVQKCTCNMHAYFDECHKMSPSLSLKLHHYFWQELRTIKVIKCPSSSSPQRDIRFNSNPSKPKVTLKWFTLTHSGTLCSIYQNWTPIYLCAFLDISAMVGASNKFQNGTLTAWELTLSCCFV